MEQYNKKENAKKAWNELFGAGAEGKEAEAAVAETAAAPAAAAEAAHAPVQAPSFTPESFRPLEKKPAATVIAEECVIQGNIRVKGGLEIYGKVTGRVDSESDVQVIGKVVGDIKCRSLSLQGGRCDGNITAEADVNISKDSIQQGDIRADNIILSGKMKGNVDVKNRVELLEEAVLIGNLTGCRISMKDGALVSGSLKFTSADLSEEKIFGRSEKSAEAPKA